MKDVSIDIETLATTQRAYILSIAAVPFDRDTGLIAPKEKCFYELVGDRGQEVRHIGASTVRFWMQQEPDVRHVAFSGESPLCNVLARFAAWFSVGGFERAWGNGATFDVGILSDAFDDCGLHVPWHFSGIRDMRTLLECAEESGVNPRAGIEFEGSVHDAQDDARYQARVISAAWRVIVDREPFEPPTVGNEVV